MIQLQFWFGGYGDGYRGDAMAPPTSSVVIVVPQAVKDKTTIEYVLIKTEGFQIKNVLKNTLIFSRTF